MNELQAIIDASAHARAQGERAALATVVGVVGSASRRPGARMLIMESGDTVGTISGGCLERDVIQRSTQVMQSGVARIIEYDTRGNEDIVWGLGLGCNGVVQILLESLSDASEGARALQFISNCLVAKRRGVLATAISAKVMGDESGRHQISKRLLLDDALSICDQTFKDNGVLSQLREDAREALKGGRSVKRAYQTSAGEVEIFFDVIVPPRALIVFGAERDAEPVGRLARMLGWHITVVDTRARSATVGRFREIADVVRCRAENIAAHVSLTPNTAAVVMTHNYLDDIELLRILLPSTVSYLGILGPKSRTAKLLEELRAEGDSVADSQVMRLHNPVGMDIGAETPEEVALAIIAEVQAVCAARGGGFLRDRNTPIHEERLPNLASRASPIQAHPVLRENASTIYRATPQMRE